MRVILIVAFILTSLMLLAITITPATASPVLMFCMKEEKVYNRMRGQLHPAVLPTDNDRNIRSRWWDIWAVFLIIRHHMMQMNSREALLTHLISYTSTMWKEVLLYIQLHVSLLSKPPTRTRDKLSSANWDITVTMLREAWFSFRLCCLSLRATSVSVSLEDSGMLLTFSGGVQSPTHMGGASRGRRRCKQKLHPLGAEAKAWSWHKRAEEHYVQSALRHLNCRIRESQKLRMHMRPATEHSVRIFCTVDYDYFTSA